MRRGCKRNNNKKSCAPGVFIVIGGIILILAFIPVKIILIILALILILLGICLCFG